MFAALLVASLLAMLWMPACIVAVFVGRFSVGETVGKTWRAGLIQVLVAAFLIYAADAAGLTNPAGYAAAICIALGVLLGGYVWWGLDREGTRKGGTSFPS